MFDVERRTELDGGLDQRAGVYTEPSRVLSCLNFRFDERGSLTKRKGSSLLATINAFSISSFATLPVLTVSTAGSLAPGTYNIAYTLGTVLGGKIGISGQVAAVIPPGPSNGSINVIIPPNNSGDGAGTTAAGADDPFNGGFLQTSANIEIYARTGADALSKQTVAAPSWDASAIGQVTTITAYTTNGGAAPASNAPIPVRSMMWHAAFDATLVWVGEMPVHFSGAHTSATYLARAFGGDGGLIQFPRFPSRIYGTIIDGVLVVSDGIGKPKKLDTPTPGSPSTWRFGLCGANKPGTAPTAAVGAATGLTGNYSYKITFLHTLTKPDGTTYQAESNASAASNTVGPANQKIDVSAMATTGESLVTQKNLYRTTAGGTVYFLHPASPFAAATTTYTDETVDASLIAISPPGENGKIANDTPPSGLYFVTEHAQRLWGVVTQIVKDGTNRILRLRCTNELRYSKGGELGTAAAIDAWPNVFSVKCGAFSPITAVVSFRGLLYVFKEDEVGVVEGDNDFDFRYRTIWKNSGALEGSVVEADDSLWCFDESRSVLRVSGYQVEDVSHENIQTGWLASAADVGDLGPANGGGRGTLLCRESIFDPVKSEVRWVMTDYHPSPTINASASYTPKFYEYVMAKYPNQALRFSIFTGTLSAGTRDRRILGNCRSLGFSSTSFYRGRDCLYGDYYGRLCRDDQVEGDLNNTVAINVLVKFPFFFGDDPEMVKLFRFLFVMLTMGSNAADVLNFSAQSLAKQSGVGLPKLILAVNGGSTEVQVIRMSPIAPFDTVRTADRGLILTISGTAITGPLRIRSMSSRYENLSNERNAT